MCGILALESGQGEGFYAHDEPQAHGLWPELAPFGSSPCIPPRSMSPRKPGLPDCFNYPSPDPDHVHWFVEHEWIKHGMCAGVESEDDFFAQVCELAADPLAVMADARRAGEPFSGVVNALRASGYPLYTVDKENAEVMLSACAVRDRHGSGYLWKLVPVEQFPSACRSKSSEATAAIAPECVPKMRGPACESNADCEGLLGCARCTHSGFCTQRPF
jgi:hypothetical protein